MTYDNRPFTFYTSRDTVFFASLSISLGNITRSPNKACQQSYLENWVGLCCNCLKVIHSCLGYNSRSRSGGAWSKSSSGAEEKGKDGKLHGCEIDMLLWFEGVANKAIRTEKVKRATKSQFVECFS